MNFISEKDITIIICTRNRAESLDRTLRSLIAMNIRSNLKWEIVVVDNGSIDRTSEVLRQHSRVLPLRSVYEEKCGLSFARNSGISAALGSYIVWTDDDVVVDVNWLINYGRSFETHPDVVLFGGKIVPALQGDPPEWFEEVMPTIGDALASRDFGDCEIELKSEANNLPFGANFAIKTEIQRQFLYNIELGARPTQTRIGEETDVFQRLLNSGFKGMYTPGSLVFHQIDESRQTRSYLVNYYRAHGRTAAGLEHYGQKLEKKVAPRWLYKEIILNYLKYRYLYLFSSPTVWIRSLKRYSFFIGQLDYFKEIDR